MDICKNLLAFETKKQTPQILLQTGFAGFSPGEPLGI